MAYASKAPIALIAASAAAFALSACETGVEQTASTVPITHTVASGLEWGPCPPIFPDGCQIAVLHGNPAQPNADIFLRVPGGYRIPTHTHSSAERMVLVEGQLNVRYKGAQAEQLTPGEYAYGPAKLPHEASCLGEGPCTLFIAFEGPVDAEAFAGSLD